MNQSIPQKNNALTAELSRSERLKIAVFAGIVFLYWISLYIYMPTLPNFVQTRTSDLATVGIVLSMYGLWQGIFRLPLGIPADWLNWRKPFLILGIALSGLGAWILGSANGIPGMIIGRSLIGVAASTWVVLIVGFTSMFPPEKAVQASAALTTIATIGRLLATSVTGLLNDAGGYGLAFMLAAAAAGLAALTVFTIPEKRRPINRPSLAAIGRLITRRSVLMPALLNTALQYIVWAVPFGFLPILARQFGASGVVLSALMAVQLGFMVIGNFFATAMASKIGARLLVVVNFGILALGVAISALAGSLPILFAGQICIGFAQGIGYPILMGLSIEKVEGNSRATAMGLHQAVYSLGMFGGPWLSGILATAVGIQPMFGITAAVCVVSGLLSYRLLK